MLKGSEGMSKDMRSQLVGTCSDQSWASKVMIAAAAQHKLLQL